MELSDLQDSVKQSNAHAVVQKERGKRDRKNICPDFMSINSTKKLNEPKAGLTQNYAKAHYNKILETSDEGKKNHKNKVVLNNGDKDTSYYELLSSD